MCVCIVQLSLDDIFSSGPCPRRAPALISVSFSRAYFLSLLLPQETRVPLFSSLSTGRVCVLSPPSQLSWHYAHVFCASSRTVVSALGCANESRWERKTPRAHMASEEERETEALCCNLSRHSYMRNAHKCDAPPANRTRS